MTKLQQKSDYSAKHLTQPKQIFKMFTVYHMRDSINIFLVSKFVISFFPNFSLYQTYVYSLAALSSRNNNLRQFQQKKLSAKERILQIYIKWPHTIQKKN